MRTAAFSAAEFRFGAGYPGPRICRTFTRKGAAVSSLGLPEIAGPLGGAAPKPAAPLGVSHGEAGKPTAPPGLLHGEARKPTAPPGLLHGEAGKPTTPPGVSHGEAGKPTTAVAFARPGAFSAARPAGTARFLITRGKASFYETATFGRRKVFFCSPFCGLLFCPTRAKLALPAGEKPAAPNPRPPRGGPAQRPRPAPGFCAASANARPGDPAPVRLLEKALWVPPTTEPFRPAPSGKPEKERKMKGGSPNAAPTPGTPTPGLARPLRLKMAGRAPSRNAPSVAESPQNQYRRSAP